MEKTDTKGVDKIFFVCVQVFIMQSRRQGG